MATQETKRTQEIRTASTRAVQRWRDPAERPEPPAPVPAEPKYHKQGSVIATLPRRPPMFQVGEGKPRPVQHQEEVFRAGLFRTFYRLLHWTMVGVALFTGVLWDLVRRRSTPETRARRLRTTLQKAGITAIKVGQQLSMRIDLIPYAYGVELEKLLDRVPPFPVERAIEEIEKATGGPLAETFKAFDPKPIGSASVSCVYQAILLDGSSVAVKVRRPNIGRNLAADLRALTLLMKFLELFWLAPGFTYNFTRELGTMLFGELNFIAEGRYIELFRRRVRKAKIKYVQAPKVYHHLSNRRVLVEEFFSGVWLTEMLAAVENDDQDALAAMRSKGLKPELVARRLLKINRWGGFEGLLFHADLHPANVIVTQRSRLMLIDFGACGAFTQSERAVWRRFIYAQNNEDVGTMARTALNLLEPLPPMDVDEFRAQAESMFWQDMYAYKSKHSEWWERTSARIWINFLRLARERNIPMNLNTLRMIRATMLVDTLALRLDSSIDQYKEYANYEKGAGKRARKRLAKKVRRSFGVRSYIEFEQLFEWSRSVGYRIQRALDSPVLQYSQLIGKAAFATATIVKLVGTLGAWTTACWSVALVRSWVVEGELPSPFVVMERSVLPNTIFLVGSALIVLVLGRRMLYRLREREN